MKKILENSRGWFYLYVGTQVLSLSLIFCFRSLWREQEKIGRRR